MQHVAYKWKETNKQKKNHTDLSCHSVSARAKSQPRAPTQTQFDTTLIHLDERQKEDSPSTESSAQSCEMIGTVNAVTFLQWSQRHCGMERWREKVSVHVLFSFPSCLLSFLQSPPRSLVEDPSSGKLNQTAWIKEIIQFVYKASFILCHAGALLTIGASTTLDLCGGHMMHLLHFSTRVF